MNFEDNNNFQINAQSAACPQYCVSACYGCHSYHLYFLHILVLQCSGCN